MVDELQAAVRRDDIDVIAPELLPCIDLRDRHPRSRRENVRQFAAMLGIEVHDNDERRAGVIRNGGKKALQGLEAAGGGANCDDDGLGRTLTRPRILSRIFAAFVSHGRTRPRWPPA